MARTPRTPRSRKAPAPAVTPAKAVRTIRASAQKAHLCDAKDETECKTQCEKGSAESCFNYARFVKKAKSSAVAMPMLKKACDGGFADGCAELGRVMSPSEATEQDEAKRPFALVVFKAEARMSEIGAFLADNNAAIVGGPTAPGVFRIAVPGETGAEYDRVVALIAAQPFVDSVTPGRRPADAN